MEINKETSRGMMHGHVAVGLTRKKLTELSFICSRGVLLRAPGNQDASANTSSIWVGGPMVAAGADPGMGGMPIPPGQALFVPIEDPSLLFVVSTAEGQDLAWMAI